MSSLLDKVLNPGNPVSVLEDLRYNVLTVGKYASSPPGAIDNSPGSVGLSGWVANGRVLRDVNSKIVLNPWIPRIKLASGGYIESSDYVADTSGFQINGGTSEFNDITVRGTIYATVGDIGGWTIGANSLSSASITIDSNTPSVELGSATNFITGTGIWMGLHSGAYKMHIGNPAADHLKWDGTDLTVTGIVNSDNISIGDDGWIGLGGSAGRFVFDSTPAPDLIELRDGNFRLTYTAGSVYTDLFTDSNGYYNVDPTGGKMMLDADIEFQGAQSITTTSSGNLTIAPAGDVVFNPTGNDILPTTAYDLNIGKINKKYLTLHAAELWVETLVAQETIATIGGRVLVGPTTALARDLASGDTTMYVKHNQMASGDRGYLEAQGKVEFISVDSAATASATNNVGNQGFETAGAGGADVFGTWDEVASDGAIDDELVIVAAGSHACKLTAGASVDTRVRQSITVEPGKRYIISFYARGDGTYGGRYSVYDNTNAAYIISITPTGITGTTYTLVQSYFVAPVDCVSVNYALWCPGTDTGVGYFDAVSLRESEYRYTITRNLDGTGANNWWAGDAVFNTGTTDDGFIDLYSVQGVNNSSSAGPTIVGNVRNSGTWNDWTEHWAIGNLDGLYGYGVPTYGVGLGKYGTSHLTIDPTDGIIFYAGADVVGQWQPGGDVTFGKVATNNANLFWDQSEGTLSFRGGTNGTVVGVTIDTDGGLKLFEGTGYPNKISWFYNGAWTYWESHLNAYYTASGENNTFLTVHSETSKKAVLGFEAQHPSGSLYLQLVSDPATSEYVLIGAGDLRIGLGLVVGSLSIDPSRGAIYFLERSSDPTEPSEGFAVIWMSNGTGKGDDGDIMIASQAGGVTRYGTLFDHSAGAAW